MSPDSPAQTRNASILQHSFRLAELLDLDSFREVCDSYSSLFQIGFKIFDSSGEKLVDVKGEGSDLCAYLFSFAEGKSLCTRDVANIREDEIPLDRLTDYTCFTGLHYVLSPIVHEGGMIGRVVFGPYLPADGSFPELPPIGKNFKPAIAAHLMEKVRRAQQNVAHKLVRHLVQTIEVMLYIGYKHALTSRMHVEAVTSSYNELQEKNRALQESYERLKELDRLKSNFLATVSHELRTPLTSVIGYSEMLLEGLAGELSEEQNSYVSTIMEKGEQLLGLIASILDYSKIESGNLRVGLDSVNPVDITRSAVSTLMPMVRKHGISLTYSATEELPSIRADGDKVRQILINIIGNAVKFNKKDGKISIHIDRCSLPVEQASENGIPAALAPLNEDFIRIVVTDTGVGIPSEKLHRIFDSFYQVDGSSTREYGGTGLGLAIARSLVEAHKGRIEVESSHGKGSTFSVLLPVERSS